jgi:proline dehydrogenase
MRAFAARQGMRFGAGRFVAGTSLDDFVVAARSANDAGMLVVAGYLGEGVHNLEDAARIAGDFSGIFERIGFEGLRSNVAVKLTHLGLDCGEDETLSHMRSVAAAAARNGSFARIDMEESSRVDATLRMYRSLRAGGFDRVGVVLQAYLHRSAADLESLAGLGPNIRLVKGAYLEAPSVALQRKRDIDGNYLALIERALRTIPFVAIATHDAAIVEETIRIAARVGAKAGERFEFQMLRGVREPLQAELVARGFPVRISVPFGADWYPYLMRRMAENPANLGLILRNWFAAPGGAG